MAVTLTAEEKMEHAETIAMVFMNLKSGVTPEVWPVVLASVMGLAFFDLCALDRTDLAVGTMNRLLEAAQALE